MISHFQNIIYNFYTQYGRKFPFRTEITPYNVLVSEVMLQQTQTGRVAEKFLQFIEEFPDFITLSNASLNEVLKRWQGLGYNRRAIALKKIAEVIIDVYNGILPDSVEILKTFPQIGHNTASSIVAFAFNKPTVFIETNIRRVYMYFFFYSKNAVTDKEIISILEKTIDYNNPRQWYYALMDYGVMLKKTHPELNKKSAHYRKQPSFKGSNRQIRGEILRILIKNKAVNISDLETRIPTVDSKKLRGILAQLENEGFIKIRKDVVHIAD